MNYRTAVILCGGKGTRLGELGKKFPKTLVKIQGKPILWYILNSLKKNNFNHFILPTGYRGQQIKGFIKKNKFKNCKIDIIKTGISTSIAQRIYKIKNSIITDQALKEGLLLVNASNNIIRFLPPLNINEDEVLEALKKIDEALSNLDI